ncbi:MAG TPA: hypothetical protein PKA64_05010, partial [Myxococcota bacterium]|nr:hypothetical protein [Myxococcota bacterium]
MKLAIPPALRLPGLLGAVIVAALAPAYAAPPPDGEPEEGGRPYSESEEVEAPAEAEYGRPP